jgi:hypothetical protein
MRLAVKGMAIFVNAMQTPEGRQEPATGKRSAESGIIPDPVEAFGPDPLDQLADSSAVNTFSV